MTPKVSVITPLYNSARFIEATLDSLLRQTYENWESVLVDDGSTDETAVVVKPYLADRRFRYIRQENRGIAGARNTGVANAAGEWVCLLDHDDRWLPEKLERQVRFALAHDCEIVATDAYIVRGDERWVYSVNFADVAEQAARAAADASVDVFALMLRLNFICTCSVMISRSVFEKFGPFDTQAAPVDDYEMWIRCLPEVKIGFINEPLVEYFIHGQNFSSDEIRMHEKAIYALQKIRPRHRRDEKRLRQFDDHLAFQYKSLFDKLIRRRAYLTALRRAAGLALRGAAGWRVLLRALPWERLGRVNNSIRYRLGRARARF